MSTATVLVLYMMCWKSCMASHTTSVVWRAAECHCRQLEFCYIYLKISSVQSFKYSGELYVTLTSKVVQVKWRAMNSITPLLFCLSGNQCCGSGSGSTGSTCFWASWIRILLSLSKNGKKNLDFYCSVTCFWLFTLEKRCKKYLQKVICRNFFF